MWNKRKEDEYPAKPAPTPSPSAPSKEPMSTAPITSYHPPERGMAVIGKTVLIKGQVMSREDLTIDGEVEGSVELQENRLTVGPHGKLQAGVKAREVVVLGTVHGNVETSDKIEIRKDARLVGDLKTARIVIEDGAYFKGSIDIIKPELAKPVPAAKQPAQHTAAASTSGNTPVAAGNSESKR
jgi:cytoskeletal protein CcmA (bactofilin family)